MAYLVVSTGATGVRAAAERAAAKGVSAAAASGTDPGPWETVTNAPNSTWLNNHCAAGSVSPGQVTTPNVVAPLFVYSSIVGQPPVMSPTSYTNQITQEIWAAARALWESSTTLQQHFRLLCQKDSSGNYTGLYIPSVAVPASADAPAAQNVNPWSVGNSDGRVGCREASAYITNTAPWNSATRRYIQFHDPSIYGCSNSHGYSEYSDVKGIGNQVNSTFGYAYMSSGDWSHNAVSNHSVYVLIHEFFHSIGAVNCTVTIPGDRVPPGSLCGDVNTQNHSTDDPDVMNGGYAVQPNVTGNCSPVPTTFRDTYVDCGRDTYWNPSPVGGSYLCTHYDLATDSLYLDPRATRPSYCS